MKTTLKEMVNRINEQSKKDNINSTISIFVTTAVGGRSTINFDTDSLEYDLYDDCTVSDLNMNLLGEKDYLYIIIIDLDRQYEGGD